ncbi:MFS transporter permease [Niastella koreensis]|uniref:Major facilitator superfamily MFS_1 n=2 Tax=Niastella koreensis TaxID=354356 RepID=G8TP39_NIAKG|nr:MFS transporter [Niastella koreensis]AEW03157.1 major facilitator superfamily MFS_1 [Niastella koreensis GR20-10]OQP55463.1 MFS transporter permease [Niastella koreensis]
MQIAPRKVVNAWCMYDWANSAYNLVITSTIFPAYYEAITKNRLPDNEVEFLGRKFVNTALYNYALGAAFIVVAFMSPILTSIADYRGNKRNFMRFFCTMGSIFCCLLYFFAPEYVSENVNRLSSTSLNIGIFCMVLACIGFWASLVFYNSFLPDLVPPRLRDRISARGYTWGYIGSVILQILCFIVVFLPGKFGFNTPFEANFMPPRISFVLVGLWWFGFAQISFRYLPISTVKERHERKNVFSNGFLELKKVWSQLKQMPVLKLFLVSFFWYSAGIQTVFLAATQFGAKELHLPIDKLIITIMIIQLVAIPGAIIISRASEKFGNIQTLMACVLVWIGVCIGAYYIYTDIQFYILGATVGLVMGGIQSLSRSTYSNLMPDTKDTASFFSFYDVTEKIALVMGMFTFAFIEEQTIKFGGMRNSVLALMVFFMLGFVWLGFTMRKAKRLTQKAEG